MSGRDLEGYEYEFIISTALIILKHLVETAELVHITTIKNNADENGLAASVFAGPVFLKVKMNFHFYK